MAIVADEEAYLHIEDEAKHMVLRPDMHIGSTVPTDKHVIVLAEDKLVPRKIKYSMALERLAIELIANAGDALHKGLDKGVAGYLKVEVTEDYLYICNSGEVIPVKPSKVSRDGRTLWIPEAVFMVFRTGSNLGEVRTVSGMNGMGGKYVRIFGEYLLIECCDGLSAFRMSCGKEGNIVENAVVKQRTDEETSVGITWAPSVEKLGSDLTPIVDLIKVHVLAQSVTLGIPVEINGVRYVESVKSFAERVDGKAGCVSFDVDCGVRMDNGDSAGRIFGAVLDRKNSAQACCLSYANGIITRQGGTHVKAIYNSLRDWVRKTLGDVPRRVPVKEAAAKKGKPAADAKPKRESVSKYRITGSHIKSNVTLVVFANIWNAHVNSQSKEMLDAPVVKPEPIDWSPVLQWKAMTKWRAIMEGSTAKGEGTGKHIKINQWGMKNKKRMRIARLWLMEGNSAFGFFNHFIDQVGGSDSNGGIPLRGKLNNAAKHDLETLRLNAEIAEITKAMGLEAIVFDEKTDYTQEKNFGELFYSEIVIATDADTDGAHIAALLLELFNICWPSLLLRPNFISFMRTPLLRVLLPRREPIVFYRMSDYDKWAKTTTETHWETNYSKGLASMGPKTIVDDWKNQRSMMVTMQCDEKAEESLELAFSDQVLPRKKWIMQALQGKASGVDSWKPESKGNYRQNISNFVFAELVPYALESLVRAIPSAMDGLKDMQRRAVWASLKLNRPNGRTQISIWANAISDYTQYHHGPVILAEGLKGMTCDWAGSNNLPLYVPADALQGTRKMLGKDGPDGRYGYLELAPWFWYIFRKEDVDILPLLPAEEEENPLPKELWPILPLQLVNGASGIASGWSTFIPTYHPGDIVDCLRAMLLDETPQTPVPWFPNFSGQVSLHWGRRGRRSDDELPLDEQNVVLDEEEQLVEHILPKEDVEDEEEDEEVFYGPAEKPRAAPRIIQDKLAPPKTLVISGEYNVTSNGIHITETPVYVAINRYKEYYEELCKDPDSGVAEFSVVENTPNRANFFLRAAKDVDPNSLVKHLKLNVRKSLTNFCTLVDGVPRYFANVMEILQHFYKERLARYELRLNYLREQAREEMERAAQQVKLRDAVRLRQIRISENKEFLDLVPQLQAMGLDPKLADKITLNGLNPRMLEKWRNTLKQCEETVEHLETLTAKDLWLADLDEFVEVWSPIAYQN